MPRITIIEMFVGRIYAFNIQYHLGDVIQLALYSGYTYLLINGLLLKYIRIAALFLGMLLSGVS